MQAKFNMWIPWIKSAARNSDILDWVLQPSGITFADKQPLQVDERITLALSMFAVERQTRIAFEHPAPGARLALAAATGLLLADLRARTKGNPKRITRDLVVVTRQIGVAIRDLQSIQLNKEDLSTLWTVEPASRATRPEGRGRPQVYVTPARPGKMFPYPLRAGAVVIDASHPLTLERLRDLLQDPTIAAAPIQVVLLPLAHDITDELFKDWLQWSWDQAAIASAEAEWGKVRTQAETSWQRTLLVCHDEAIDACLEKARVKLITLSKAITGRPPLPVLQAWGIYHRLAYLAVPLGIYEQHALKHHYAQPLKRHLEHLAAARPGEEVGGLLGAILASEWGPLIEGFVTAYELLKGVEPAKFWGTATIVEEYVAASFTRPLVLVCPTEIESNILLRELSYVCTNLHQYLHPNGLMTSTFRALACHPELRKHDLVTVGPYSARWRFLDAALPNSRVLVYPHEAPVEQLTVESVLEQVARASTLHERQTTLTALGLIRPDNRVIDSSLLTSQVDSLRQKRSAYNIVDITGTPVRRQVSQGSWETLATPNWVWDPEDLAFVPPLSFVATGPSNYRQQRLADIPGPKAQVFVRGGEPMLVPRDYVFDVYRSISDELDEREAEQLETGDILILINDSQHTRLFERMVEALESSPGQALMRIWIQIWESAKHTALNNCEGSYSKLHHKLTDAGTVVGQGTVRSWFVGTMGPRDEQDVYRVIDVSGDKAAISHKTEIRSALGHIRGFHRRIGRRISALVRQVAVARTPERLLDNAIDIALEDVLAAAHKVIVERVELLDN